MRRLPLALLLALAALWAPRSAPADTPLGGIATIETSPGDRITPLGEEELSKMRELRQAPQLILAGTVITRRGLAARYEFHHCGRLTEPSYSSLDMKILAGRLAGDPKGWTFAGWRISPVFDRNLAMLFWAYDVKHPKARSTLSFAAFFTRDGVLLFQRTSADLAHFDATEGRFRELLSRVTIRPGRTWRDFTAKDPVAAAYAEDLVANRGVPRATGGAHGPSADGRTAGSGSARRWLPDFDAKIPWRIVLPAILLFGIPFARWLARQRRSAEEITMPPGAGGAPMPKPFDPEDPKRR